MLATIPENTTSFDLYMKTSERHTAKTPEKKARCLRESPLASTDTRYVLTKTLSTRTSRPGTPQETEQRLPVVALPLFSKVATTKWLESLATY